MNKKRALRRSICFASLLILAAVFFVLELVSGSTDMSASEVFSALTGSGSSASEYDYRIYGAGQPSHNIPPDVIIQNICSFVKR